ncbi:DEAD/DEAH box helicase [Methylophaga frappieri]|nr:DEAD/DEAH box helicase [Methylophaga frappieri]
MQFDDLFLDDALLDALQRQGFTHATMVQQTAIPALLSGQDVLACAATGTGKTAAFVLPILQKLMDEPNTSGKAQFLIFAPTRELAFQIQHVFHQLGSAFKPIITMLTGGASPWAQVQHAETAGADIIIATPGRILSLVNSHSIDLTGIEMVVIDEADRMLDMGQGPDVLHSLAKIGHPFQAGLFSATLAGSGVRLFAESLLKDPQEILLQAANQQAQNVTQEVYLCDNQEHKQAILLSFLAQEDCTRALVFCNKKIRAESVCDFLQSQNISAQLLHGDFDQSVRRERIRKFRSGQIRVTVATDVAARGLDVADISHVINYDVPFRGDAYIHRIGRTGRADKYGLAINLVEPHDHKNLQRIEHHVGGKLPIRKRKGLAPKSKSNKAFSKPKNKPRYIAKKERQG